MAIRVAIIGAGSIGFTRQLMHDILAVPELQNTEFTFTDINHNNLDMITRLAERDIRGNKLAAKVLPFADRREALTNADYVINCVRIGGLEAFKTDVEIPLKYGVDQCVGDTLCVGGIMYGQRSVSAILDFCKDIREIAKPDCQFLNYANPNAMNTWAANHYGKVQTIGLCHGVQNGHRQITDVIELLVNRGKQSGDRGFKPVNSDDVDIICAGINHQTWYIQILYRGEDWTNRLLEGFEKHPIYSQTEKIRIDILRRFGYYCTESNGHLSEYLPWYRKRPEEIVKWISLDDWQHGETAGYLRVCTERRQVFEVGYSNLLDQNAPKICPENRSQDQGSYIIEALETGRVFRGHFNVPNRYSIHNLPADCIVEIPGYVDRCGISITRVGNLPLGCAAVCNQSIWVQRLAVEAAVNGDVTLLKQAAMLDPLTGASCNTLEISQMIDEMLVAQANWLPRYKDAIPLAKARLANEKSLAIYSDQVGLTRQRERTIDELLARQPGEAVKAKTDNAIADADTTTINTKNSTKKTAGKKFAAKTIDNPVNDTFTDIIDNARKNASKANKKATTKSAKKDKTVDKTTEKNTTVTTVDATKKTATKTTKKGIDTAKTSEEVLVSVDAAKKISSKNNAEDIVDKTAAKTMVKPKKPRKANAVNSDSQDKTASKSPKTDVDKFDTNIVKPEADKEKTKAKISRKAKALSAEDALVKSEPNEADRKTRRKDSKKNK